MFLANATAHMREHDALELVEQVSAKMQQSMGVPLPDIDYLSGEGEEMPAELEQALTVAASQNLPPLIGVQPGSVAEEEQKPQTDKEDPVSAAESKNRAREAEAMGKMDVDLAKTAAQIKRDDALHEQKMKQNEEAHRAKLQQMSEETAAGIIREAAKSKQQQQHESQKHVSKLTSEAQTMGLRERQAAAQEKRDAIKAKQPKKKAKARA
jgi:hypothetical protein